MDVIARGARVDRLPQNYRWPGGRHVAVVFNMAFEAWSNGKAPGIGPMGNPLPGGIFDTNALAWGHYGAVRGIGRLLRVLDRTNTRGSIMVSGVLAERIPNTVKAIADAGHEIVAHAYAQEIIPAKFSTEEDAAHIAKTTELISTATGSKPKGWISPRGTPGPETARLLLAAGYEWQGDVFDDDLPYLQTFDSGSIVAIPLSMEINDLPHAMRFGRSPQQFVELFNYTLEAALVVKDESVIIDVTAHCHCYGHPAGAAAYETIARAISGRDDVWVTTRYEIAELVRTALA